MCSTGCVPALNTFKLPIATVLALAECRHKTRQQGRHTEEGCLTNTLRHHRHDVLPWYILLLHPLRAYRMRSPWEPCRPRRSGFNTNEGPRPSSRRAKRRNTCAPDCPLCMKTPHPEPFVTWT